MYSTLQNIEPHCKALCLALHETTAQHMPTDSDERRRALVKLTIKTLQKLLGGGDSGNSGNSGIGGGKAMSLETVQAPGGGDLSYFLRHFS